MFDQRLRVTVACSLVEVDGGYVSVCRRLSRYLHTYIVWRAAAGAQDRYSGRET